MDARAVIASPDGTLVDKADAARLLGVSRKTVDRLIRRGKLPAPAEVGRRSYWVLSDLLDAIRRSAPGEADRS
jgi:excisionase family DNA binding protein